MNITILYITAIIFIFIMVAIFYVLQKKLVSKYSSSKFLLDILDQLAHPAIIIDEKENMVFNKMASKFKKHIKDVSELSNGACFYINDAYYKIARIIPNFAKNKEIIIFGHDTHKHDAQILEFLTFSDIAGVIIDEEFKVIMSNSILNEIIPFKEGKISNFLDIINPEDHKKFKEIFQLPKNGKIITFQEFTILGYNKVVLIYVNRVLVHGAKHFICKIFDITQYKTIEAKLAHAQRMQAVGELAGTISHDFNNLLTGIIGFSDILLLRQAPGDESFDELTEIKQNANRASNLVRQLLAFSSQQVLIPKVLNIGEIISDLSTLIKTLLGENITLELALDPTISHIKADQGQIEQVIINLAVNAKDAMDGKGKLLFKTSKILVDNNFNEANFIAPKGEDSIPYGEYVLIEVEDTGAGISIDILEKIFEPFFSTKGPTYGTGLGLATVYGIIKQTGGHIRLQTKLNNGTKFSIFLLPSSETKATNETQISHKDAQLTKNLLRDKNYKGKILIVEDEGSVRLFGKYALINKNYDVCEADNAESALKILETEGKAIDLIITDVMMPGMTGPEMAEKIVLKYPHIKFLFTSGYAEDAVGYFSDGKHYFLPKPFSINELATKVKEVISSE